MLSQLLIRNYAKNIITYGNRTFSTIDSNYVQPTKQNVADNYTLSEIDTALVKSFITEDEHSELLNLRSIGS